MYRASNLSKFTMLLLCVQALPAASVTVVAEQLGDTTSLCAGGLWKPYTLVRGGSGG